MLYSLCEGLRGDGLKGGEQSKTIKRRKTLSREPTGTGMRAITPTTSILRVPGPPTPAPAYPPLFLAGAVLNALLRIVVTVATSVPGTAAVAPVPGTTADATAKSLSSATVDPAIPLVPTVPAPGPVNSFLFRNILPTSFSPREQSHVRVTGEAYLPASPTNRQHRRHANQTK